MIIGDRLRAIRMAQKLSYEQIERLTGITEHCILSIECGQRIPDIETLEKIADALGILPYQLFYDGVEPPLLPNLPHRRTANDIALRAARKKQ